MSPTPHTPSARWLFLLWILLAFVANASAEWKEKVLYSFQGGNDGYTPAGGVVFDKAGNLYGANSWGGSGGCPSPGCGTVFELSPPTQKGGAWTETTIYAFQGVGGSVKDGLTPEGGVIIDQEGNLYGTTTLGGNGPCVLLGSPAGCGIVYELSPPTQKGGPWTETILHSFQGGNDGYFPIGDLVLDPQGNLYGATWYGGGRGSNCDKYYGGNCGTVFKLSPSKQQGHPWTEKILHSFAGVHNGQQVGDGADPNGRLVRDGNGAVYGTTYYGGKANTECGTEGCGTVFKLTPPTKKGGVWTEKILWSFDGPDGGNPGAGVGIVFSEKGDLFGTTVGGGDSGYGIAFQLRPGAAGTWTEAVLYRFTGRNDGASPRAGLVFSTRGDLYGGATESGGNGGNGGNVFRLQPPKKKRGAWSLGVLHIFTGRPDGAFPAAGLAFDKSGNLYSTTQSGGTGACYPAGCGTVFETKP